MFTRGKKRQVEEDGEDSGPYLQAELKDFTHRRKRTKQPTTVVATNFAPDSAAQDDAPDPRSNSQGSLSQQLANTAHQGAITAQLNAMRTLEGLRDDFLQRAALGRAESNQGQGQAAPESPEAGIVHVPMEPGRFPTLVLKDALLDDMRDVIKAYRTVRRKHDAFDRVDAQLQEREADLKDQLDRCKQQLQAAELDPGQVHDAEEFLQIRTDVRMLPVAISRIARREERLLDKGATLYAEFTLRHSSNLILSLDRMLTDAGLLDDREELSDGNDLISGSSADEEPRPDELYNNDKGSEASYIDVEFDPDMAAQGVERWLSEVHGNGSEAASGPPSEADVADLQSLMFGEENHTVSRGRERRDIDLWDDIRLRQALDEPAVRDRIRPAKIARAVQETPPATGSQEPVDERDCGVLELSKGLQQSVLRRHHLTDPPSLSDCCGLM